MNNVTPIHPRLEPATTCLLPNEQGGLTYASAQRIGQPENRSEILADLRMMLDALGETTLCQTKTRETTSKLLDMLAPDPATAALRAEINADLDRLHALAKFNDYILARVRGGAFKRLADMFQ